jgi:hemolysin III
MLFLLDDRVHCAHFVWHLFVLTGSTCHFLATLRHAAL